MNKSLRYIALLAIIPLFTTGLTTDYFTDADAIKGKGVGTSKYGSSTDVCGLQICSEIPGGKAAWMEQQKMPTLLAPVTEEETIELEEEITMEETVMDEAMMEEPMMEETMMEKITEADLGSVLRLSRANVPAVIPLHQGYYDGGDVHFIITDSSDPKHAEIITENQGWQVELAPTDKGFKKYYT